MAYHDAQHLQPLNPPGGSSQDETPEHCADCGEPLTPEQPCANCAEQDREARREARPPIRVQIVVFDTLVAEAIIEPE